MQELWNNLDLVSKVVVQLLTVGTILYGIIKRKNKQFRNVVSNGELSKLMHKYVLEVLNTSVDSETQRAYVFKCLHDEAIMRKMTFNETFWRNVVSEEFEYLSEVIKKE